MIGQRLDIYVSETEQITRSAAQKLIQNGFVTVNGETGHKNYNEEGNGLRFGLGAQINPTPSIGIRAMLRYTITDMETVKNMKEFTVGLRYYF